MAIQEKEDSTVYVFVKHSE